MHSVSPSAECPTGAANFSVPSNTEPNACIIGHLEAVATSLHQLVPPLPTRIFTHNVRCWYTEKQHAATSSITCESPFALRASSCAELEGRKKNTNSLDSTASCYGRASNSPPTTSASMRNDEPETLSERTRQNRTPGKCRSWSRRV